MSMTAVDLDDAALERARLILGTRTKKETINTALQEVVRRQAATDLIGLLKGDSVEFRDHRQVRRSNWHDRAELADEA